MRSTSWSGPRTLVKVSFMPAKDVDAVSSAVAEDRTATVSSCRWRRRAAGRRRGPPGAPWSACRRCARPPGSPRPHGPARWSSTSSPSTRLPSWCRPGVVERLEVGAAVTTKPGGTGNPAQVSSPRLAPFPPTWETSPFDTSANHAMHSGAGGDSIGACVSVVMASPSVVAAPGSGPRSRAWCKGPSVTEGDAGHAGLPDPAVLLVVVEEQDRPRTVRSGSRSRSRRRTVGRRHRHP